MQHISDSLFTHRDLAARNVMVATGYVCKVGDFGLSQAIMHRRSVVDFESYGKTEAGFFPIRWTAPEAFESEFSVASDVWAYGVVLVEMCQDGRLPYGAKMTNEDVIKFVVSGKLMERPLMMDPELYELVLKCWRKDPSHRVEFKDIVGKVTELFEEHAGSFSGRFRCSTRVVCERVRRNNVCNPLFNQTRLAKAIY